MSKARFLEIWQIYSVAFCQVVACIRRPNVCRRRNALELAIQQSGSLAARKSLENAASAAVSAKDGTGVAIVEVPCDPRPYNPIVDLKIVLNRVVGLNMEPSV